MSEIVNMRLYGGPCDGELIEIHKSHLELNIRLEVCRDGESTTYGVDNDGKLVWLPDPQDPRVSRGFSSAMTMVKLFQRKQPLRMHSKNWTNWTMKANPGSSTRDAPI